MSPGSWPLNPGSRIVWAAKHAFPLCRSCDFLRFSLDPFLRLWMLDLPLGSRILDPGSRFVLVDGDTFIFCKRSGFWCSCLDPCLAIDFRPWILAPGSWLIFFVTNCPYTKFYDFSVPVWILALGPWLLATCLTPCNLPLAQDLSRPLNAYFLYIKIISFYVSVWILVFAPRFWILAPGY